MRKDNVDLVFEELRRIGQCKSRSDFSRNWLGREEAYYRGVQSKGQQTSVEAQVNLASKLRDLGTHFARSTHPKITAVGDVLLKLHGQLLDVMLSEALINAQKHTVV
jgi:hypothetical protein